MCQSKSRGHHDGHSHHHDSEPIRPRSSARGAVTPDFQPTRRQVLGRLTAVGLVSAASGSPLGSLVTAIADDQKPPPRGQTQPTLFDFKKVADGIFGAIAKPTAMLNCNAAVIVNRDHVLVVDTHSKPSAAKALIRQIRDEITPLPVRYVAEITEKVSRGIETRPGPRRAQEDDYSGHAHFTQGRGYESSRRT